MLPSPLKVITALVNDAQVISKHIGVTLMEAGIGLLIGILVAFVLAVVMDEVDLLYKLISPLLVVSQTVPTVAIAPLLVLWFGYDIKPKVILIIMVTFFPLAVGLLQGLRSIDPDERNMLLAMGASKYQIFKYLKFPSSLPYFFAGLRISASYAVVGAVIAEWLGGFYGLGVYMTRVKKSFAFDKMFGVIIIISLISLALIGFINFLYKKLVPWEDKK